MGGTVKLRAELPRSDWNVILSNLEYQKFESPWLVEIINKLEKEITGGGASLSLSLQTAAFKRHTERLVRDAEEMTNEHLRRV